MKSLATIYPRLLSAYGSQSWWPVTKKGELHPSYDGGPRNERQEFEVIIGALLTQ